MCCCDSSASVLPSTEAGLFVHLSFSSSVWLTLESHTRTGYVWSEKRCCGKYEGDRSLAFTIATSGWSTTKQQEVAYKWEELCLACALLLSQQISFVACQSRDIDAVATCCTGTTPMQIFWTSKKKPKLVLFSSVHKRVVSKVESLASSIYRWSLQRKRKSS